MVGLRLSNVLGGLLFAAILLPAPLAVCAQDSARSFDLPQDPRQWINTTPWNLAQLKGKAAFLLFFEEDCPKCKGNWPSLNTLSQNHADDPILFIAVSSGTQRGQMENYIRQNKVSWPVLLDPDRTFEKACDIDKISLENITQIAAIAADGSLQHGPWGKPEELVDKVLKDAKWTINPRFIPPVLKPTWQQVEFQNYLAAAPVIRKSLKSPKEEIKAGAESLWEAVQPLIEEQVKTAEAAYDAGEKWKAFRAYSQLLEQFKGYEMPENVESRKKELQTDSAVKGELAAMKIFDAAQRQASVPAQQKKAISALKRLVKDKPDTEAGQKAQALLAELEAE